MRLAVMRLANLDTIYAKEPSSPVVLAIRPTPPLSDAQIRRLTTATPWNPVMIEAEVDFDHWENAAFCAEVQTVESAPKPVLPKPRRRVPPQAVFKQYRGFISK